MVTRATPTARSGRKPAAATARTRATTAAKVASTTKTIKKPARAVGARSTALARSSPVRSARRPIKKVPAKSVRRRVPTAGSSEEDGRRLRAARNYEAVVTAVLDIAKECPPKVVYLPSAAEVAARAGVSERTVFRHFADLNALFVAAASRIRPIQEAYVGPRPSAPRVADRIAELVQLRSKLYEESAPVRRVAIHLSHTHPLLVEQLAQAFAAARAQVADVFAPELSRLDAKDRSLMLDALDLAASWASWDNLRTVQDCSVPRTRQIVTKLLSDLLATVPKTRRR
jgi:AcrR family transcriptional regulator